jgi:glycosyltransferase involved in cell wall biosynthesis
VSAHPALTFDLVLATMGRTSEPRRFLESLATQTGFRVIVVDQNPDDRLSSLIGDFETAFPIIRLRSEPGLSRARNTAFPRLTSAVVAFPDDDCWYPPTLLQDVGAALAHHPEWDGLSGRSVDEVDRPSVTRWDSSPGWITPRNVWRRANSVSIFLRRTLVERTGRFDEALGAGAGTAWGACEEIEYLLRGIAAGAHVRYEPRLLVHHPRTREQVTERRPDPSSGYAYGMGMGRVLQTSHAPRWFVAYHLLRAFGAASLALLGGRTAVSRFYFAVGRGRLRGWRSASTAS